MKVHVAITQERSRLTWIYLTKKIEAGGITRSKKVTRESLASKPKMTPIRLKWYLRKKRRGICSPYPDTIGSIYEGILL